MAASPYPSAAAAQLLLRQLEFADARRAKRLSPRLGPEQIWKLAERASLHAEGAKIAGDMTTARALLAWAKQQHASARMLPRR